MTAPEATPAGSYTIEPARSRLGFVVRHALLTQVHGHFESFSGTAHLDAEDPTACGVEVSVDAASVRTGSTDRDRYLTSTGFFGGAEHPRITFTSTDITRAGTTWTITGDLTIKGTTRSLAIDFVQVAPARDPSGAGSVGFTGRVTVRRSDWGLSFPAVLDAGRVLVAEKIGLELVVWVTAEV